MLLFPNRPDSDSWKYQNVEYFTPQVDRPPHYTSGDVECIEAIEAVGIGAEFCQGNAIKYLWRMGKKGPSLTDARKAQWYVDRLVGILEREADTATKAAPVNGDTS